MKIAMLTFLLLFLIGCAATLNVTRFDAVQREPTGATIEVFSSPQNITRPYKEIALITAEEGWDHSEAELTRLMIVRARDMGADAIILLGAVQRTSGGALVGGTYVASTFNFTRCTAIVYTDKH
jgi:hypothetical protein